MVVSLRDRIVDLHGPKILRKSAMNIRGGAGVFERVMSGKGYRTVVEIGTYRGVSAAEMSQYCDRVVTIDLKQGKLEKNGDEFNRIAFWNSLGRENIDLFLVKDDAEKAALLGGIEFDFAFIDGAHDYRGVSLDFDLVKKCGRVLFHDADDNGPGRANDVFEFISTIPKNEVEFIDIFALWQKK